MKNSPNVVFNYEFELAINNPDRNRKSIKNIENRTTGMFDYFANIEKGAMNIFDYYTGKINKEDTMNLVLENGKYATKEDIEKRKQLYKKYIKDSNLAKCVVSFNNDYLTERVDVKKMEQILIKDVIPMYLKKCGYKDIKKMSYQLSLHTDTDNLHFHFSYIEKEPNFEYYRKGKAYKRVGMITKEEINFFKNQVEHCLEKEQLYTPLLIKTNKEIDLLKKYFNPKEKSFLLKDKQDLILEENILRLGRLLSDKRNLNNKKFKYNSINDIEIKRLTNSIKKYIFSKKNNEFNKEYGNFKDSINAINVYFKDLQGKNNIKDINVDNSLIKKKEEYLNNYILNSIVNHANYNYKHKKITENDIIEEIVLKEYLNNKKKTRFTILNSYLSSKHNLKGKYKIEQSIKSINSEMEDAQKEFSKLFAIEY